MKSFLALFIFFFSLAITSAQERDTVRYRVFYQHSHVRDLADNDSVYAEYMVLLLGAYSSLFVSYDKLVERVVNREYAYQEVENSLDDNPVVRISGPKAVIPQEIVKEYGSRNVKVKEYLGGDFLYEDTVPQISWRIGNERRNILGLDCTSASGAIKGRVWNVWFSPDMPVSAGPWLLSGLPGLIVEAVDGSGQVSYKLDAIETVGENDEIFDKEPEYNFVGVTNLSRATRVTKDEFFKLRKRAFKQPNAFRRAQIIAMHGRGGILDFGVMNSKSWASPIPNPIDLEEMR